MRLRDASKFPVTSGCELEFNGFITAAPNLFIELENAANYSDSFTPPRPIEQKTYLCSEDVSIQYAYWEVAETPQIPQACQDAFEIFLAEPVPFPQVRARTQAEAQIRADEILVQFPFGFAVPRSRGFGCSNGTSITYWIVESQI